MLISIGSQLTLGGQASLCHRLFYGLKYVYFISFYNVSGRARQKDSRIINVFSEDKKDDVQEKEKMNLYREGTVHILTLISSVLYCGAILYKIMRPIDHKL